MKKLYVLVLGLSIHLSLWSQNFYFEGVNETSTAEFGSVESFNESFQNTQLVISPNQVFNKNEGWELTGIDDEVYYYQITDQSSASYGQIDTWDGSSRTNYGNLSDIYTSPEFWVLSGVDHGVLYFQNIQTGGTYGEIESWDGVSRTDYADLDDGYANPSVWKMIGIDDGLVYTQWINTGTLYGAIETWDGENRLSILQMKNIYDDPLLFIAVGVDTPEPKPDEFIGAINQIKEHVNGVSVLSATQLLDELVILTEHIKVLEQDESSIQAAFELVNLYESTNGALFTEGSTTEGGYSITDSGFELENVMLIVQQGILDHSYSMENLINYPHVFNDTKFETSSYFPGSVDAPVNRNEIFTVKINGNHPKGWGALENYVTEDARRPTGCYLAPGSIATVTVPSSLVGIGASILVGAHTWNLSNKSTIKRMDRVTVKYEIDSTTVTIGNPLGGGIYINVPYEEELGVLDVSFQNVVRSPYFARTAANQTSIEDWQNIERGRQAPWADFETDKFMMQVPTSWISAMDDPETVMNDWDLSMDAISEFLGRPLIRSKTVVYAQVDVIARGSANFPGYPQSNVTYDPYASYNGNYSNYLVNGPRDERGYLITTFFHEQGHAEKVYKFDGEIEAFVNFLWVAVYNKKFGVDLQTAFSESFWSVDLDIDQAATSWMITENFRTGMPMSSTSGQFRNEFSYQHRGYAKYADIVLLFGWEALEQFYINLNESYENGTYEYTGNVNYVPADGRMLRLSEATGFDMRPLIHFWGIHPDNPEELEVSIQESGVNKSAAIYDRLMFYKTQIPSNNDAFRTVGLENFSLSSIENFNNTFDHKPQSYYEGFFNAWWNDYTEESANDAVTELDYIIDLYFPEGRPCEETVLRPFSKINNGGWTGNTSITLNEGDNFTLGPQPFGTWSWVGQNDFTASSREISLLNVALTDSGEYVGVYTDAYGCENELVYDVKINDVITSINSVLEVNNAIVYPTVFQENIRVEVSQSSKVMMYNQLGSLILKEKISDNLDILTSDLSAGRYFIHVFSDSGSQVYQVVKH